jgi:hypothetical protein
MAPTTPKHRRLKMVKTLRDKATQLRAVVQHDSAKLEISWASEDLDEATRFLGEPSSECRTPVMAIVDLTLKTASERLGRVEEAVREGGPDVNLHR